VGSLLNRVGVRTVRDALGCAHQGRKPIRAGSCASAPRIGML